jgi:hypothetical protein
MLFVKFHGGDVGALDRQVVAGCPCPGLSGTIALVNADGALFAVEDMPTTVRGNGRVKREVDAVGLNHLLQPQRRRDRFRPRRAGRGDAGARTREHV